MIYDLNKPENPPLPSDLPQDLAGFRPRRHSGAPQIDRVPPCSLEAEQSVLGAILSDSKAIAAVSEKPNCLTLFYDLRHQTIFGAMKTMFEANEAIDLVTLHNRLKISGLLDAVGGVPYISSLCDACPSSANLPVWLDILEEKAFFREAIRAGTEIVTKTYDNPTGGIPELAAWMDKRLASMRASSSAGAITPIKTLVHESIEIIEACHQNHGALTGLSTGFPDIDKMTNGLQAGEMIVIAARPSLGKTSLAMNMVDHMAVDNNISIGVFSLEMTSRSLVLRMLCSRARVNLRNMRDGFMAESDFPKITNAAGRLIKAPIFIDDTAGLTILQLRSKARLMVEQHGIKAMVVDYLQVLRPSRQRTNRNDEVSEISNGVKALAKELNIPVVILAQLGRIFEREKRRRPCLADLKESGAIEQDADVVGLLYHASKSENNEEENAGTHDATAINCFIAKQRNGPTGDVHLTFLKAYTRFESAAKVAASDVPEDPTMI